MKIGWLEILLIIFVLIAVAIIVRIIRPGRIASRNDDNHSTDIDKRPANNKTDRRSNLLTRTGIALMAAGGIALIAGVSMLQWVVHNYVLSLVLIICGLVILIISRRKRH